MKKVAQAPSKPHFDKWKEYQRCLEELDESQEKVKKFKQGNKK